MEELNAHKAEKDLLTAQLNLQLGKFQAMFSEMQELQENFVHQVSHNLFLPGYFK
jgi:hypothetical protein